MLGHLVQYVRTLGVLVFAVCQVTWYIRLFILLGYALC
jgi:hypothetical protein